MPIYITTSSQGDTAVIKLVGNLDFFEHQLFHASYAPLLHQDEVRQLEVDLADIHELNSAALGMFLLLEERIKAVGKTLVLSRASHTVVQMLALASLSHLAFCA